MTIEERVENLIKDKIEDLGYKLVRVTYGREMGRKALTVFIDNEENRISLKDCELVSKAIEPILDEADIIKERYYLIVSSKGVEL